MKKQLLLLLVALVALTIMLTSCEGWLDPAWPSFNPDGIEEEENVEEKIYPSVGLEYKLLTDDVTGEEYYMIVGIGNCDDTHIRIPETYHGIPITHIGVGAFMNEKSITEVTFTQNIKSIGDLAFAGTSITKFEIPDSVEMVSGDAIATSPVKEIVIGKNCVLAPMALARSTALETITVHEENKNYEVVDGVLYGFNLTEDGEVERVLIQYPTANEAKSFVVPEDVAVVDWFAFSYANNLEEITLPVGAMLNMPFFWCDNLKKINYPIDFEGFLSYENLNNSQEFSGAILSLTKTYLSQTEATDITLANFEIVFNDATMTSDELLTAFNVFMGFEEAPEVPDTPETPDTPDTPDNVEPEGSENEGTENGGSDNNGTVTE